jgi:aldose 1-epimerase
MTRFRASRRAVLRAQIYPLLLRSAAIRTFMMGTLAMPLMPKAAGAADEGAGMRDKSTATLADGRVVESFRLANANGVAVDILSLGGIIRNFLAPDRDGKLADIALGYSDLEYYAANKPHFGALIGRYANRIANAEITIDGTRYALEANRPPDIIHGGANGFDKHVWTVLESGADHLKLALDSPDGDAGFPGAVHVEALYSLSSDNALRLDFHATTTKPTVIALTNHASWNLAGEGDVLDHVLEVAADSFTPAGERLIPTGEIKPVAGTPLDFRKPHALRDGVMQTSDPQIAIAHGGIDHNFVLRAHAANSFKHAARLSDPKSGRVLTVLTTEPGLQVYTGNSLAGGPPGKWGRPYEKWEGIALETQHFPDTPHHPNFPSVVLRPGDEYRSSTVFRVSVDK